MKRCLLMGDCPGEQVVHLQSSWEQANYKASEDDKEAQFEQLVAQADSAVEQFPRCAEILIWQGIIKSTYAGVAGGLSALSMVKEARSSLEKAIKIDGSALEGSAYTSLGALYYQVPGWPIGFGNSKKARSFLEKIIAINPNGIDANFFYAEYLAEEREYEKAEAILQKALGATARPGREIADDGRKKEIHVLLASVREKIVTCPTTSVMYPIDFFTNGLCGIIYPKCFTNVLEMHPTFSWRQVTAKVIVIVPSRGVVKD